MRILVIEDELKVARFLKKGLEAEGYEVETAADGKTGEKFARTEAYDLILLDVLLPQKGGFEILRDLRKDEIRTPILMLTARSTTEDIVGGLDQGADDYLTKPFAFTELLARIRSLMRRGTVKTKTQIYRSGIGHNRTQSQPFRQTDRINRTRIRIIRILYAQSR